MRTRLSLLLFVLFLSLLSPLEARRHKSHAPTQHKYRLSACMIFCNEAPYLKEWLEYHLLIGVEHFFLYNNLSTDHYKKVLQPYIDKGLVELIDWNYVSKNVQEWDKYQVAAYNDCLHRVRGATKWLAIIDSDEFVVPVTSDSLPTFLEPYEKMRGVGGILVNWVAYGTSNVAKIPDDRLLIETLVYSSIHGSSLFKTICMVDCVSHVISPHYVVYKSGWAHSTPSGKFVLGIETDKIRINHYWARDEWYLEHVKIPRRKVWNTDADTCRTWARAANGGYDTSILRFVEPLRKRMQQ